MNGFVGQRTVNVEGATSVHYDIILVLCNEKIYLQGETISLRRCLNCSVILQVMANVVDDQRGTLTVQPKLSLVWLIEVRRPNQATGSEGRC